VRMSFRVSAAVTAALVVLALVAVPSFAALPSKGATYTGQVAGKVVTVKISKKSRTKAKYTFDCGDSGGPVGSYVKLTYRGKGVFSGVDKGGIVKSVDSLKIKFTSSKRARGKFTVSICDGKGGKLTLKRQ
jgi:hypothetical protein